MVPLQPPYRWEDGAPPALCLCAIQLAEGACAGEAWGWGESPLHLVDPVVSKDVHVGEQSQDGFSSQLMSFAKLPNNTWRPSLGSWVHVYRPGESSAFCAPTGRTLTQRLAIIFMVQVVVVPTKLVSQRFFAHYHLRRADFESHKDNSGQVAHSIGPIGIGGRWLTVHEDVQLREKKCLQGCFT